MTVILAIARSDSAGLRCNRNTIREFRVSNYRIDFAREILGVPFTVGSVGIQRADVENHLRTIREDPERLAPLAAEYDRRHADEPALTAVVLCQRITHLKDGAPHGDPEFVEVVRWEADA